MMRDSWSRPSSSVPNQWAADGPCVVWRRSCAWGSWGDTSGARMASRNTTATMARPMTASLLRKKRRRMSPNCVWPRMPKAAAGTASFGGAASSMRGGVSVIPSRSFQADPGVEVGVGQVDDEVHDHEGGHPVGDDGDDDRVVLGRDGRVQRQPDPGPVEDRLGDQGPAEEPAEGDADVGDDGDDRVAQDMFQGHRPLGETLGVGGADVVRPERLE